MNQSRRLQRLSRFLLGEFGRRELSQFLVHKGQKLLCQRGITSFNLGQDTGDVEQTIGLNGDANEGQYSRC